MSRQPLFKFRSVDATHAPAHNAGRDPFKLERRREDRHDAEGVVLATYSDGAGRFGVTHLELIDRSSGGMRARTLVPIEPGSIVNICPEGSTIPWLGSRAVRCEASGEGFVIGMRY